MNHIEKKIQKTIKKIRLERRTRRVIAYLAFLVICSGATILLNQELFFSQQLKISSKFEKRTNNFNADKIMIKPEIEFKDNDGKISKIWAEKAINHNNLEEFTLYQVVATGDIGSITANYLEIKENGNLMIFGGNPSLIIDDNNIK
jgi:hypothetical protein